MHDQPKQAESHAGVLRSTEHYAGDFFEFGGQKLPLMGTSGPPKEAPRTAEGKPLRHEVFIANRTTAAEATSGSSQVESRVAEGLPVQHGAGAQSVTLGQTGQGQLVGGPIRRA
jgi:hypothetical protein